MDPSYIALLAFNTVSGHFSRHSQQRTTTQEGDRQRAFQQQQFEAQREEQRRQAKERREQEWALATRQRQTALELQENQKVLDHWPLRLFPSQILQSHRCDGPTPLRVFLSLPVNGPRDLEGPVRQALQQFLSTHYNFNLGVRPIELLDGAWKDCHFQGAASIKALHERLRSEPTLVLETQMPEGDDHLYVNLAYWGPAQDQYLYQTLEKIAYRPLVEASARDAAQQWRQARERLVEQGVAKDCLDADQRFGGVRAANLKRLEQEEALSAAGIGLDQVDLLPFQLVKEDWRGVHQFLITWHCLVMGWIGDLYHFSYWETPPILPKLLPDLLHADFPPEVARAFIDHYCRSYRAVAAERPAWGPELALQLAVPLAALPDPAWGIGQVAQAIQDWLDLRGVPSVAGAGVGVIDGFCAQVGAADGPVGPALLLDPDFLAKLCDAIGHMNRPDLVERFGSAANAALKRHEREHQKRQRPGKKRQERERVEHERQERLGQVPELQRLVAESLGLGPVFRDPLKDGSEGPEMVVIPPGAFVMGAPESDNEAYADEKPQHQVRIARAFAIGRYPVTFEDYDRFLATVRPAPLSGNESFSVRHKRISRELRWGTVAEDSWGRGRRPVTKVSSEDAVAYCAWLSKQTGHTYRLPTEAEWEYACRAGTQTRWSFGDDENVLGEHAWFCANSDDQTQPVGEKRPNRWGLYDMHGNVWEWVQDRVGKDYIGAPTDGSERPASWWETDRRLLRGGAWNSDPARLRCSRRGVQALGDAERDDYFGFRVALTFTP